MILIRRNKVPRLHTRRERLNKAAPYQKSDASDTGLLSLNLHHYLTRLARYSVFFNITIPKIYILGIVMCHLYQLFSYYFWCFSIFSRCFFSFLQFSEKSTSFFRCYTKTPHFLGVHQLSEKNSSFFRCFFSHRQNSANPPDWFEAFLLRQIARPDAFTAVPDPHVMVVLKILKFNKVLRRSEPAMKTPHYLE